jgi:hypothetical protein
MKRPSILLVFLLALCAVSYGQSAPCGTGIAHCNIITVIPAATQPAGVVVTGWNLYKASSSGGYGATPFATNTDPTVLKFQDNTVAGGQTNFYVLTAVCKTCTPKTESVFSNELVATTPTGAPAQPSITVQSF